MIKAALPLALVLLAPAAARAGTFTPPEGCQVYVTVQARGCLVSNLYKCVADPAGDQWRADFGQNGMFFVSRIDSETQWVESFDVDPPTHEVLESGAKDPASFSDLLANGVDSYDFSTVTDEGVRREIVGQDRLTGEKLTIDGVELERTEYHLTALGPDGSVLWAQTGHEYISREWRTFLAGAGTQTTEANGDLPYDNTPVSFAFPGQKGFAATLPLYDCDTQMSSLSLPDGRVIR